MSKIPMNWSSVVSSKTSVTEDICEKIIAGLIEADFSQEDIFAVHLALEEAFINAVKHGNQMNPEKKIGIEYCISSDKIEISITDEGKGFSPEEVPDPRYGNNLYKCDGRGILLMKSYMDVDKFNKQGNRVDMIRYKGGPCPMVGNSELLQ